MSHRIFKLLICLLILFSPLIAKSGNMASFDDTGWHVLYQENFDTDFTGVHGQTFGENNWLIFQLFNGGSIDATGGYAQLSTPDFWEAALIRSTKSLPGEYKIRVKIGYINYDLTNYEQADYDNPDFNNHSGHYENGIYFLTLTEDTCVGDQCAEDWWHFHRKMVIDVDNHINWGSGGGETFHPVFMVYMDPNAGSGGNYLRTWDGDAWDVSPDNWNVAYTYDYDTWYYAELEKFNDSLVLRLYDASGNIIEETTPVDLSLVFAMDNPVEFLYIGEPHTDDYEGDARIDEITLLTRYLCGDANGDESVNIADASFIINYIFFSGSAPDPLEAGDANYDGSTNIVDASHIINYIFFDGNGPCEG